MAAELVAPRCAPAGVRVSNRISPDRSVPPPITAGARGPCIRRDSGAIAASMHLPTPESPPDTADAAPRRPAPAAARAARQPGVRAAADGDVRGAGACSTGGRSRSRRTALPGLLGVLTAPLLHGSLEHLIANAISLLMLGTLAGACIRARRCARCRCCGSAQGWARGCSATPGSHHLGASGAHPRIDVPGVRARPAAPRPRPRSPRR